MNSIVKQKLLEIVTKLETRPYTDFTYEVDENGRRYFSAYTVKIYNDKMVVGSIVTPESAEDRIRDLFMSILSDHQNAEAAAQVAELDTIILNIPS